MLMPQLLMLLLFLLWLLTIYNNKNNKEQKTYTHILFYIKVLVRVSGNRTRQACNKFFNVSRMFPPSLTLIFYLPPVFFLILLHYTTNNIHIYIFCNKTRNKNFSNYQPQNKKIHSLVFVEINALLWCKTF